MIHREKALLNLLMPSNKRAKNGKLKTINFEGKGFCWIVFNFSLETKIASWSKQSEKLFLKTLEKNLSFFVKKWLVKEVPHIKNRWIIFPWVQIAILVDADLGGIVPWLEQPLSKRERTWVWFQVPNTYIESTEHRLRLRCMCSNVENKTSNNLGRFG